MVTNRWPLLIMKADILQSAPEILGSTRNSKNNFQIVVTVRHQKLLERAKEWQSAPETHVTVERHDQVAASQINRNRQEIVKIQTENSKPMSQ